MTSDYAGVGETLEALVLHSSQDSLEVDASPPQQIYKQGVILNERHPWNR